MKLLSNFADYYDCWFDRDAEYTLRRYGTDGLDRFCQLHLMERNGLKVPAYGDVRQLIEGPARYGAPEARRPRLSKKCQRLVVYTDPKAHCTEGKILVSLDEALEKYPDCLATEYIEGCYGVSWRYLQLGLHGFWIEYKSNEDWRSNYGDGDNFVIGHTEGWGPKPFCIKLPLFAIDFAIGDELYAVDFNIAPGVQGSGVHKVLTGREAAESIKQAYFEGTYLEDVERYYYAKKSIVAK